MASIVNSLSLSRRGLFYKAAEGGAAVAVAGAMVFDPFATLAVVDGRAVPNSEAAAVGAVGLWIDLAGCSVCRHDVPAACSGTLVARDLVLSARHCLDIPRELNGTLDKVVFSNNLLDPNAPSAKVAAVRTPADYGFTATDSGSVGGLDGTDLMLIKLATPAPAEWRPQRMAFGLEDAILGLSSSKAGSNAGSGGDKAVGLTELIGNPSLMVYGFGDSVDDFASYSSGLLHRLPLVASSEVGPAKTNFFAKPVVSNAAAAAAAQPPAQSQRLPGTCNGDSGSAALLGTGTGGADPAAGPASGGGASVVVGVVSATSVPCAGSTTVLVNPGSLRAFLTKASADLGSPLPVASEADWKRFLNGGAL
eukprot:CAMPEP_0171791038 /NCGR_PEP_ID=MMETSP0991-20121206/66069_1 /TAXON_ID=483369 /ORGANISM="non described non described, Strain CCMP2098" /LENGTH=363 /DNA_ID=CAMNT_0012400727 /DNA_START=215 /DNA_END=1306 /DNA_ORIENTATION=-